MYDKPRPKKIFQLIVEQIEEAIIARELKPGERLPIEKELQEKFQVSRGTLREALRVLEQRGLVELRTGVKGGIFVRKLTTQHVSDSLDLLIRYEQIQVGELAAFREAVEIPAVKLAAEMIGKKDINSLKKLHAEAEEYLLSEPPKLDKFYEVEGLMHRTLACASGNRLLTLVLMTIHNNRNYYHYLLPMDPKHTRQACKDWGQIIKNLENGKIEKATFLMKNHIHHFDNYMLKANKKAQKTKMKPL
jgi:GntR family transcriptional regulator, transcriptional repressor for pyruvate dehydrogenase complex